MPLVHLNPNAHLYTYFYVFLVFIQYYVKHQIMKMSMSPCGFSGLDPCINHGAGTLTGTPSNKILWLTSKIDFYWNPFSILLIPVCIHEHAAVLFFRPSLVFLMHEIRIQESHHLKEHGHFYSFSIHISFSIRVVSYERDWESYKITLHPTWVRN